MPMPNTWLLSFVFAHLFSFYWIFRSNNMFFKTVAALEVIVFSQKRFREAFISSTSLLCKWSHDLLCKLSKDELLRNLIPTSSKKYRKSKSFPIVYTFFCQNWSVRKSFQLWRMIFPFKSSVSQSQIYYLSEKLINEVSKTKMCSRWPRCHPL